MENKQIKSIRELKGWLLQELAHTNQTVGQLESAMLAGAYGDAPEQWMKASGEAKGKLDMLLQVYNLLAERTDSQPTI